MGKIFIEFLIVATVVVIASKRLAHNAEYMEENSSFNPIFMGLMLALATSLPELVSSLTSVSLGNDVTAVSNVLGSNAFNIFALFVINIVFFKEKIFRRIDPATFKTAKVGFVMYILFVISFLLERMYGVELLVPMMNFTITSVIIVYLYSRSVLNSAQSNEDDVKVKKDVDLTRTRMEFVILVIINVVASMILAHTAEDIILHSNLSEGIVGALLVGGATSLPEIITCYALIRKNKYEMAVTSIIGSNTFNFVSFTLLDFSTKHSIYLNLDKSVFLFALLGIGMTVLIYFSGVARKSMYLATSVIGVALYIATIALSSGL